MIQYNKIIKLLDANNAKYEVSDHEPVVTSAQAEKVTGFPMEMAAKSIVFKVKDNFVLVVVRGTNLVDFKKIKALYGSRKARLARPEEVKQVMGVEVGACYPFGEVADIEMLVDETLDKNELVSFSPGLHDKHIRMPWSEYKRVAKPKLIDIVKS